MDGNQVGVALSGVFVIGGSLLWAFSHVFRVFSKDMTYSTQLKQYEDAVIQKRFEELEDDEVDALLGEIERERRRAGPTYAVAGAGGRLSRLPALRRRARSARAFSNSTRVISTRFPSCREDLRRAAVAEALAAPRRVLLGAVERGGPGHVFESVVRGRVQRICVERLMAS